MIEQYNLALAAMTDSSAIAELSRDTIEYGLPWTWTPQRVARSIRDRATNVVVARQRRHILGFGIMKYEDEEAHLLLLAVEAGQRRRGIGTALLHWLEATVTVAGIPIVLLETRASNGQARAFYRSHGFAELGVHHGYYQGVEDAMRMGKNLRRRQAGA